MSQSWTFIDDRRMPIRDRWIFGRGKVAHLSDVDSYLLNYGSALNMQSMAAVGWMIGEDRRLDVVVSSLDGLFHRWWPDPDVGGWHPMWEPRGGTYASRASLVARQIGTGPSETNPFGAVERILLAFALDLHGRLVVAGVVDGSTNASGQWPTSGLGAPPNDRLISHPTAVIEGQRLHVYARAESRRIWGLVLDWNANIVENWHTVSHEGLPPRTNQHHHWAYAPAAASWGPGRTDLFAVDEGSTSDDLSNTLWHAWREGGVEGPDWESAGPDWEELGIGGVSSSPDAAVWPRSESERLGVINVVACGPTESPAGGSYVFARWLGRHWTYHWLNDPRAISDAAIASWGKPRLDLFYVKNIGDDLFKGPFIASHAWREGGAWTAIWPGGWNLDDADFQSPYPVPFFPA